jgi:GT2 family glycosyltransferase
MKIATIILNWNNYTLTRACVASFKKIDNTGHEVIVVDNFSQDGSTKRIQKEFPRHTYIYNWRNAGFSIGNNLGMVHALGGGAEYIFLLNNDAEIIKGESLKRMVEYMDAHPEIGIMGPKLFFPDGRYQPSAKALPRIFNQFYTDWFFAKMVFRALGWSTPFDSDKIQEVDYVTGAALMIRRKTIEDIGLLDGRFFFGHEDADWCKRCWDAGWKVVYFPVVSFMHVQGGTGKLMKDFKFYYRDRLRYFAKHYSFGYTSLFRLLVSLGAFLRVCLGILRWLLKRDRQNLKYVVDYASLSWYVWFFPWRREKF